VAALYELGHLRLVGEGGRLGVQACLNRAERPAVAKQNRPLAAYWRQQVLAARLGGTEREQNAGSIEQPALVNTDAHEHFVST